MAIDYFKLGTQELPLKTQTFDAIEAVRPLVGDAVALCRREYIEQRWVEIGDDPERFAAACRAMIRYCSHTEPFEDIIGKD
jgi:hypothetical protein